MKKKKPTNTFIFLLRFLDLIAEEISLTMWTVTVLSSQLRRQAAIKTVPAHNFPRLRDWEQAQSPCRTSRKTVNSSKTPPLPLEEDGGVWHQSHLSEKITFYTEKQAGKDAAARNSYQVSNQLKLSDRSSGVPQWGKQLSTSPTAQKQEKSKEKEGRKMGRNPLCPRRQRTRMGVCTWSCWPRSWSHQSCRRNSSVPVLPTTKAEDRGFPAGQSAFAYGVVSPAGLGTRKYFKPWRMLYLWQSSDQGKKKILWKG